MMLDYRTYAGLLDPAELAQVGRLDVIATRVVEGYLAGMHRSPFRGNSVEFAEHRAYSQGDEIGDIDWRVYARSDRYYVKLFEEETNQSSMLVVDASGSMDFGQSTVSKFSYASMAAAILARLLLQQSDGVGMALVDEGLRDYIPPRSVRRHLDSILQLLGNAKARGETRLAVALHELAARFRRRGLVIIFSDCFEEIDALRLAFQRLYSAGHQVVLMHIMAPEELNFTFEHWTRFVDIERNGERIDLDARTIRGEYLSSLQRFLDDLKRMCGEVGVDYMPLTTVQPLGTTLGEYMRRRAGMKTGRRRL